MIEEFLGDGRRRGLRPSTLYQQGRTLRRLERSIAPMCLGECTLSDLTAFVDRLDLVGSRATEISHIRSFYRWAVLDGKMDTNPAMRLLRPKVPRRLPRPISNEDLAMALTMAPTFEHSILMLAAYAGLRACEICQLRARSVLWTNVPRMIVIDEGKGGHEGAVPLHPVLEPVVRSLPNRGWLYPAATASPDTCPGTASRATPTGTSTASASTGPCTHCATGSAPTSTRSTPATSAKARNFSDTNRSSRR